MRALVGDIRETVQVWPDNKWTWRAWKNISTQWVIVVGLGGAAHVCLRHEAIPEAMEAAGVPKKHRQRVRQGLRVMERAALPILNKSEK